MIALSQHLNRRNRMPRRHRKSPVSPEHQRNSRESRSTLQPRCRRHLLSRVRQVGSRGTRHKNLVDSILEDREW